ncbi:MAG: hypothetical protein ACYT04_65610, partial [Nostoc sp.]
AIAYSTQKVMIFSSDSSSLMLFFPLRIEGDGYGGKLRILNFSSKNQGRCDRNQITLAATLPNAVSKRLVNSEERSLRWSLNLRCPELCRSRSVSKSWVEVR